jgi:hypothetical protein
VVKLREQRPGLKSVFAADLPDPPEEAAGERGRRRGGKK